MSDKEIEQALQKRAYDIDYDDNGNRWIIPKDNLSQETLAYIDRLKTENEQIRKETAKEIFDYIIKSGVIDVAPNTIKMHFKEKYGVEVDE